MMFSFGEVDCLPGMYSPSLWFRTDKDSLAVDCQRGLWSPQTLWSWRSIKIKYVFVTSHPLFPSLSKLETLSSWLWVLTWNLWLEGLFCLPLHRHRQCKHFMLYFPVSFLIFYSFCHLFMVIHSSNDWVSNDEDDGFEKEEARRKIEDDEVHSNGQSLFSSLVSSVPTRES